MNEKQKKALDQLEVAWKKNVTAMIYYLKTRDRENWGDNQPEPLKEIPAMIVKTINR